MYQAVPFDGMAADYDASFTQGRIGRRMRAAVWRRLEVTFRPGERVLELNCGTGEDALHLGGRGVRVLATDVSPAMLAVAQAKIDAAGLARFVDVAEMAIEDLSCLPGGAFDGVLSNFGGLNCVADFPAAAREIARMLRPGGRAVVCLMGPAVPWEWGWFLAQAKPRKAWRRLARGGSPWRGLMIRYPSVSAASRAFAPWFTVRRVSSIGALLPPTYAEPWARRHPRLLAWLDRCERRAETWWPLPRLADHYLLELERR